MAIAGIRNDTPPDQVERALGRWPNAPGAGWLRRVIHGDELVTLSALEARFIRLLRENGLPLPETNRPAGTKLVDCRCPAQGPTVELDGYRYHRSRHAWEQDRQREREAHARGDRYSHDDVGDGCVQMLADLQALLSARSPAADRSARR